MNCYHEDGWNDDDPKKTDDPYAKNEEILCGGCGHNIKDIEFSAAVFLYGFGLMLLIAGVNYFAGLAG